MKVQAKIRVDADAEIIIHYIYLRIVFAGRTSTCNGTSVSHESRITMQHDEM